MWVKGVQVTNFVAGCLFLAYWMLRLTSHHVLYRFVKFYYLTYLWLFLDFFSLYPLLIWRESVDRTKWYRNLKFCTLGLYSVSNRYILPFFDILKATSGLSAKLKIFQIVISCKVLCRFCSNFTNWRFY